MGRLLQGVSALACAGALAACGGGAASGGEADPATIVPADAKLYLEITAKPDGDLREDALEAAGKLLRTDDPGAKLRELGVDLYGVEGAEIDYDRDVEPWLGDRVGLYVSNPAADDAPTLLALATTDMDKARAAVTRFAAPGRLREASYGGVKYDVAQSGVAVGEVGGVLAVGFEHEMQQAIDAAKGESLAESDGYRAATAALSDERLATGWFDLAALGGTGAATPDDRRLRRGLRPGELAPVAAAMVADGSRIRVESSLALGGANEALQHLLRLSGGASVPLIREAPAEAWAVLGVPDLGAALETLFPVFSGRRLAEQAYRRLETQGYLDVEGDLYPALGDAAIFVRGTDSASLDGAAIVEATDPAKARRVAPDLAVAIARSIDYAGSEPRRVEGAESAFRVSAPQLPEDVIVAYARGRLVVAWGEDAAVAALAPRAKLGDAPGFEAVSRSFGDGTAPASYVAMPQLLEMLDAPALGLGPTYTKGRRYLETIASMALGGAQDGDRMRAIAAFALK